MLAVIQKFLALTAKIYLNISKTDYCPKEKVSSNGPELLPGEFVIFFINKQKKVNLVQLSK